MRVKSIAEAFASYQAAVLPPDAPAVQVEECRRAFYAGSYTLLMNVAYHIGDDSTSEDEGIEQLEALKAECETFAAHLETPLAGPPLVEQHGYNVRNADVESALRSIADQIKPQVPDGFGFTLLMFSYGASRGPGQGMFYISSARREDMVTAMQEFIARNTQ